MPYVSQGDGEVVGIGEPVAIRFDEKSRTVRGAEGHRHHHQPARRGRVLLAEQPRSALAPRAFLEAGHRDHVAVNTYGVDMGNGMFGEDNVKTHFSVGDEVIATADDTTKIVTVRVNGEVVKTMPTSMGKDSTPTANGVYIIGGRFKHIIMDSSTYGVPVNSPNGYRTDVEWATQMSYSGVYVHSRHGRWAPKATPTPATGA